MVFFRQYLLGLGPGILERTRTKDWQQLRDTPFIAQGAQAIHSTALSAGPQAWFLAPVARSPSCARLDRAAGHIKGLRTFESSKHLQITEYKFSKVYVIVKVFRGVNWLVEATPSSDGRYYMHLLLHFDSAIVNSADLWGPFARSQVSKKFEVVFENLVQNWL